MGDNKNYIYPYQKIQKNILTNIYVLHILFTDVLFGRCKNGVGRKKDRRCFQGVLRRKPNPNLTAFVFRRKMRLQAFGSAPGDPAHAVAPHENFVRFRDCGRP